jgi:hypothetical protein
MTPAEGGTRLTVSRTSEADLKDRQVIVTVDGRPFATLLFGQQATRPIDPGAHTLRANNTLVWKTVAFDAAEGEHVRFSVVNRATPGFMWMVGLVGVGPIFVEIERQTAEAPTADAPAR